MAATACLARLASPGKEREKDQVSQVHCTEARRGCCEASDIDSVDELDRPAAQLGRASMSDHPHRVDWTLVEGMDQPICIDPSVELTPLGVTRPNRPCVAVGPSIRGRQTRPPYAFQDEDSYTVQEDLSNSPRGGPGCG